MAEIKTVPYNNGTEQPIDQLQRTATQLRALTVSICGNGFENFSGLSDELQSHLLWLVDGLADQINVLSDSVAVQLSAAREP